MPRELAVSFATKMQLSAGKNIRKITASDINKIIDGLKNYDLRVTALGSYTEAVITAGGVSLADIHSKTMQSKLINNLYFAGELIDLDANTGGYNLQIAFSTGFLAGLNVLP
jgi:predicted flavoprotein YhiN